MIDPGIAEGHTNRHTHTDRQKKLFRNLLSFSMPVIVMVVLLVPLVIIWSLNTLFMLGIPYTLETWAAALILVVTVGGTSRKMR